MRAKTYSGQVLGPTVFGFTYSKTASRFPSAIFVVCAVISLVGVILLAFVRLPKFDNKDAEDEEEASGREERDYEETLVQL